MINADSLNVDDSTCCQWLNISHLCQYHHTTTRICVKEIVHWYCMKNSDFTLVIHIVVSCIILCLLISVFLLPFYSIFLQHYLIFITGVQLAETNFCYCFFIFWKMLCCIWISSLCLKKSFWHLAKHLKWRISLHCATQRRIPVVSLLPASRLLQQTVIAVWYLTARRCELCISSSWDYYCHSIHWMWCSVLFIPVVIVALWVHHLGIPLFCIMVYIF